MTERTDPDPEAPEQMPAYQWIAHLEMATRVVRPAPRGSDLAYLLGYLCLYYAEEERYDEAIAAGQRALRTAVKEAAENSALRGHVLLNLGVAHSRSGDLDKGLAHYLESWKHARRSGDEGTSSKAGANALLVLESGRPVETAEFAFLEECRVVGEATDRRPEAVRASRLLGEALLARGRPVDAIALLDRVLVLAESLRGARTVRRETVQLLEEADRRLGDRADVPPLGPGVLREVRALVDDGVENVARGIPTRTRTCLSRALTLLERRGRTRERVLAAFLMLVVARLAWNEDDEQAAAELLSRASEELELIKPAQGTWVKTRAFGLQLGELSALAHRAARGAREQKGGA
ncbi:tetratricopeptide repeat protein [Streptomyces sp. NPDC005329]|uniref:tetratricopeptide repeat protein n=1 Tax=Streptomyces sp. NPDC005329 TaxID=3157034 RepID=UPI0033B2651D